MPSTSNKFIKGLNKDISKTDYQPNNYYNATNFKVVTDGGLSTFALENTKGTKLEVTFPIIPQTTYETGSEDGAVTIPLQQNFTVIGYATSNNDVFVFTTTTGGYGQIWKITFNEATDSANSPILLYNRNLNFSSNNRIKAKAIKESDKFYRLYFVDDLNPLRSINTSNSNVLNIPQRTLDFNTNVKFDNFTYTLEDGNLPNGKIFYFYRLVTKDGHISAFSPTSVGIDLAPGNISSEYQEYPESADFFKRDDNNVSDEQRIQFTSEKSVKLNLTNIDLDYDYIQVGYVLYQNPNVPEVFLFNEVPISIDSNGNKYYTFIHDGNETNKFPITIEEYNILNNIFISPKTFDIKNNILFLANTTNEQFSIDEFDSRAYRFRNDGTCNIYKYNTNTIEKTFDIGTLNYPNNTSEAELDCWNPYNQYDVSNTAYDEYKYNNTASILGGSGPNINYTFSSDSMLVDEGFLNPNTSGIRFEESAPLVQANQITTPSFGDFKSPYKASYNVGYARGEVYRFGITFFNKAGKASYIKWIADIRIPENNELSLVSSSTNSSLNLRNIHINFDVTIPQSIIDNYDLESFKIVRVERTEQNRTKLGMGITGGYLFHEPYKFTFADIKGILSELIVNFVKKIIQTNPALNAAYSGLGFITDLFGVNLEDQLKEAIENSLNNYTIPEQLTFQDNLNEETIETLIKGAIKVLAMASGGFATSVGPFAGLAGFIGDRFGEQIFSYLFDQVKDVITNNNVAGIKPKIYSLGGTIGGTDTGYIISPIHQFNEYNFRTNDYIRLIGNYDNQYSKVNKVYHTDRKVGVIKRVWSTAAYRKWYNPSNISLPNRPSFGTTYFPTITKENTFDIGEILQANFDNNTANAAYVNAYVGMQERYQDNNFNIFIPQFSNFKKTMGIGNKKQWIKCNTPIGVSTNTYSYYDNQGSANPSTIPQAFVSGLDIKFPRVIDKSGDYLVSYERILQDQYQGASFVARALNTYIDCSDIIEITPSSSRSGDYNTNIIVAGGDTYVGVYDSVNYAYYFNLVPGYSKPDVTKKALGEIFPCEAPFNFMLREEQHFAKSQSADDLEYSNERRFKRRLRRAERRAKREGLDLNVIKEIVVPNRFLYDEFKYNTIYNQERNSKIYIVKPVIDIFVNQNSNRIWRSGSKINGELIDQYRIFKPNDFIDVDGEFGEINELVNFKDRLVFYQDAAIGIASSNERSLTQDQTGASLQLSSLQPLVRYDYLSIQTGCKHRFAVVPTNDSLYHFDVYKKKIMRYSGGIEPISDTEGISSFLRDISETNLFNDNTCNIQIAGGVHGVYYPEYNTVYFTFLNYSVSGEDITRNDYTIAYNQILGAFESFHSFTPGLYINSYNRLISSPRAASGLVYSHFKGNRGIIYNVQYNSDITIITNPQPSMSKTFNNLCLATEVFDTNNVNIFNDTVDSIRCLNDYQDTGTVSLTVNTNIKRKERKWHLQIPRDINSSAYTTLLSRMRDLYIFTTLTYNNSNNRRLVLHDIETYYMISNT
jgi:hypothetical protein